MKIFNNEYDLKWLTGLKDEYEKWFSDVFYEMGDKCYTSMSFYIIDGFFGTAPMHRTATLAENFSLEER